MKISELVETQRRYVEQAPPPARDETTREATDEVRAVQPDHDRGQVIEVSGS